MDKLDSIWKRQEKFNFGNNFGVINSIVDIDCKNMTSQVKEYLTQRFVLHAISETDEILRECQWKDHKKYDHKKQVDREKILEEIVDLFKFTLCIAQVWGFTADEFHEKFMEKSTVVEKKFSNNTKSNRCPNCGEAKLVVNINEYADETGYTLYNKCEGCGTETILL